MKIDAAGMCDINEVNAALTAAKLDPERRISVKAALHHAGFLD